MLGKEREHIFKEVLGHAMPRSVLITGAGGMLGRAFTQALKTYYPNAKIHSLRRSDLDVGNRDDVMSFSELQKGDWILHCAALVNVEKCELDPARGGREILQGTQNTIDLAKKVGAKLFYPQSFLIYDGSNNPIDETTLPAPLSKYGELKYEAEKRILAQAPESLVVRMAGFFGGEEADKNFVGAIIPKILAKIKSAESEFEVGDRTWQPTWTLDLALNSLVLMGSGKTGVYQMSCQGTATFYDLAKAIVEELGWDKKISIKKVSAQSIARQEIGRRPEMAILTTRKLRTEGLDLQRSWRESLHEYLRQPFFEQYRMND
ncbi:MAG: sugar nucleotide-binding protein [Bdellovibrionales bacterium]|nr:sugar nucleotide-binding protein [Bdellovibrionales bacterium]